MSIGTHPHRAGRGGRALLVLGALLVAAPVAAQQQPRVQANWALADKFTGEKFTSVIYSSSVTPRWVGESDSLIYSWRDRNGTRHMLVVPGSKAKQPLFDHKKLAAALSAEVRRPLDPAALTQIQGLAFSKDRKAIQFTFQGDSSCFQWNRTAESLTRAARSACVDSTATGGTGRGGGGGGGGGGQGRQGGPGGGTPPEFRNFSPDSSMFAFARDHNIYVVNVASKDTVQLSKDGAKDYSFGARDTTAAASCQVQQTGGGQDDDQQQDQERGQQQQQQTRSRDPRVRANVVWSPDSKAFYVQRSDSRKVQELYLVNSLCAGRPALTSYKYAMPGEENVSQQELHAWKKGDAALTKLPIDKWRDQRLFSTHWTVSGGDKLRLIRRDRLQRNLELIEVNLATNAVSTLLTESVRDANLESPQIRYLSEGRNGARSGDFMWWSERTGWGQYYLYDHNAKFKNAITTGTWRAEQVVAVDSVKRVAWVAGVGREAGEWPYYRHMYRVNLDGTGFTIMDEGDANHAASAALLSPKRRYYVDNFSRVDQVPKSVLRDANGKIVMELETMDMTGLQQLGWKAPERFVVKAADGITDIYGNIFKPFDFDPNKKYPIIANVYPGPQTESITFGFTANSAQQRLAQLGFIVIQIGNRGGSPQRSNAYQSFSYYNMRDYGLADKKAGIEQLAARHPWIDIDRVGIYGHSGGGFMTAAALMLPPYNDFFKVGVSSAGNHDNNMYNQNWSEQYHGLREVVTRPTTQQRAANGVAQQGSAANGAAATRSTAAAGTRVVPVNDSVRYEIRVPTNAELAANLKGKLLLVHGDMDNNVHPGGTIRLVDALIKANKRFDMMILPGKAHGFADMQQYFNRMMFEYFAEHLLGDYYRTAADIK